MQNKQQQQQQAQQDGVGSVPGPYPSVSDGNIGPPGPSPTGPCMVTTSLSGPGPPQTISHHNSVPPTSKPPDIRFFF